MPGRHRSTTPAGRAHGRPSPRRALTVGAGTLVAGLALVGAVAVPLAAAAAEAPVGLGTADSFAVLAGSGITNTGATTIAGDVGSSPTPSQSGFDSVTQTSGTNYATASAVVVQAKTALTAAYTDAAARPATRTGTQLAGLSLGGGVYDSADGTFNLSGGTLTLTGDESSVFIFQTDSTLVLGSGARVQLAGTVSSCNVFWQVGSAATLGTGSTFVGSVLAHDDISLGDAVSVDGRLLAGAQASGAGAVTLIGDTITRPTCTTAEPTTTTTAPTTTTTTTTPSSTTTTTTAPTTTTTTAPTSTTTTTTAALPASTTTALPATTTTTAPAAGDGGNGGNGNGGNGNGGGDTGGGGNGNGGNGGGDIGGVGNGANGGGGGNDANGGGVANGGGTGLGEGGNGANGGNGGGAGGALSSGTDGTRLLVGSDGGAATVATTASGRGLASTGVSGATLPLLGGGLALLGLGAALVLVGRPRRTLG